jgi:hypothetical protein
MARRGVPRAEHGPEGAERRSSMTRRAVLRTGRHRLAGLSLPECVRLCGVGSWPWRFLCCSRRAVWERAAGTVRTGLPVGLSPHWRAAAGRANRVQGRLAETKSTARQHPQSPAGVITRLKRRIRSRLPVDCRVTLGRSCRPPSPSSSGLHRAAPSLPLHRRPVVRRVTWFLRRASARRRWPEPLPPVFQGRGS